MEECSGHGIVIGGGDDGLTPHCECFPGFTGYDELDNWKDCHIQTAVFVGLYGANLLCLVALFLRAAYVAVRCKSESAQSSSTSIGRFHAFTLLFTGFGALRITLGLFGIRKIDFSFPASLCFAFSLSSWLSSLTVIPGVWYSGVLNPAQGGGGGVGGGDDYNVENDVSAVESEIDHLHRQNSTELSPNFHAKHSHHHHHLSSSAQNRHRRSHYCSSLLICMIWIVIVTCELLPLFQPYALWPTIRIESVFAICVILGSLIRALRARLALHNMIMTMWGDITKKPTSRGRSDSRRNVASPSPPPPPAAAHLASLSPAAGRGSGKDKNNHNNNAYTTKMNNYAEENNNDDDDNNSDGYASSQSKGVEIWQLQVESPSGHRRQGSSGNKMNDKRKSGGNRGSGYRSSGISTTSDRQRKKERSKRARSISTYTTDDEGDADGLLFDSAVEFRRRLLCGTIAVVVTSICGVIATLMVLTVFAHVIRQHSFAVFSAAFFAATGASAFNGQYFDRMDEESARDGDSKPIRDGKRSQDRERTATLLRREEREREEKSISSP